MHVSHGEHKKWIHVIDDSHASVCVDVTIESHGNFEYTVLFLTTAPMTYQLTCHLNGAHAHARMNGVYAAHGDQKLHVVTKQIHNAPDTLSELFFQGVAADISHVHFAGTITIPVAGVRSHASLTNKTILLSNTARVISQPELQVIQHDVQCAHGTAISSLEPEQLYFMQSRGLENEFAKRLLLQAFLQEPLSCLTNTEQEQYSTTLVKKVVS